MDGNWIGARAPPCHQLPAVGSRQAGLLLAAAAWQPGCYGGGSAAQPGSRRQARAVEHCRLSGRSWGGHAEPCCGAGCSAAPPIHCGPTPFSRRATSHPSRGSRRPRGAAHRRWAPARRQRGSTSAGGAEARTAQGVGRRGMQCILGWRPARRVVAQAASWCRWTTQGQGMHLQGVHLRTRIEWPGWAGTHLGGGAAVGRQRGLLGGGALPAGGGHNCLS